jgi:hypothetical protein
MITLTAEGPLQEMLGNVKEAAEIRDPSGKVLGLFTPVLAGDETEAYARAETLFDADEMERLAQTEQGGYSIDEVMEHLRSLEKRA